MNMLMRKTLLAATVATMALAAQAEATVMTQSVNVGGGTASLTTDLNHVDFSSPLSLFDATAFGPNYTASLNSVTVSLTTAASVIGNLTNNASGTQSFTFDEQLGSYLASTSSDASAANATQVILKNFGTKTAGNIRQDFGAVDYTLDSKSSAAYPTASGASVSATPSVTLADASSLAAFMGQGNLLLNFNTTTFQNTDGGGGNIKATLATRAGANLFLAYDYTLTQVPEPASVAMLGMGLVAMGLVGRRKAG